MTKGSEPASEVKSDAIEQRFACFPGANTMIDYLGLALLAAWTASVWCFIGVLGSSLGLSRKALWGAVLLVPVIGVLAWFLLRPRKAR